jgi:hypothetical protein
MTKSTASPLALLQIILIHLNGAVLEKRGQYGIHTDYNSDRHRPVIFRYFHNGGRCVGHEQ